LYYKQYPLPGSDLLSHSQFSRKFPGNGFLGELSNPFLLGKTWGISPKGFPGVLGHFSKKGVVKPGGLKNLLEKGELLFWGLTPFKRGKALSLNFSTFKRGGGNFERFL